MKSLIEVFTSVNAATMFHLYHVSSATPIKTVLGDGPTVMNLVSSSPKSLKAATTTASHTISSATARRLSSNSPSTHRPIIYSLAKFRAAFNSACFLLGRLPRGV